MSAYAIFRLEKVKDKGSIKRLAAHHERTGSEVSNARPPYDSQPVLGAQSLVAGVESCLPEKHRKDAVLAMDFVLTASPHVFNNERGRWDKEKIERFTETAKNWLKDNFGDCVHARLHLDETSPHVQGFIVPCKEWKPGNSLSAKTLFNRTTLSEYQTSWHSAMQNAGFEVERGKLGSEAKHESIKSYYARVNAEPQPLPRVSKAPPPPTAAQRVAAAAGIETEHSRALAKRDAQIKKQQKALLDQKKTYEAKAQEAEAKADALERRARDAERKLRKMKETTAQLRQTPLALVLEKLGATMHRKDPGRWETQAGSVWIDKENGVRFNSFTDDLKGSGAIDLVMQVQQVDYKNAVAWLASEVGELQAASEIVTRAALVARAEVAEAQQTAKPAPLLPDPEPSTWPRVRRYLEEVRKIPATVVDALHRQGRIFSDRFSNAVFMTDAADGAELRGTRSESVWKGHRGSKSGFTVRGDAEHLIVCESALEALSAHALTGYSATSTGGMNARRAAEIASEWRKAGATVYAGQNNDRAGREQAEKLMKDVRGIERLAPRKNDFNDDLRAMSDEQRQELLLTQKAQPQLRQTPDLKL